MARITGVTKRDVLAKVVGMADAFTADEIAVAERMIAQLDKKYAGNGKPTKRQAENADIKVKITEFLDANDKATATEIGNAVDVSCQRASALLKQMNVPKAKIKGKMYYGWDVADATSEENEDNE